MPLPSLLAAAVDRAIEDGQIPGAVVLVGRGAEVLHLEARGERMLQPERRPMLTDTVFDLASLSKPLATATAVMQLVERGLLAVEQPACRYLPAMRPDITLWHLLTHSSGIPAYKNYPSEWGDTVPPAERRPRMVDDICGLPPIDRRHQCCRRPAGVAR